MNRILLKKTAVLILLFAVFTMCSCSTVKRFGTTLLGPTPEQELFYRILQSFESKSYDQALSFCDDYLSKFPDGPHTQDVMMKRAMIFSLKNEFEKARQAYNSFILRFPESPLVEEARIGIMSAWYHEKRYGRVLELEKMIDDSTVSEDTLVQKYSLLADSYLGLGKPMDAAYVLISALKKVGRRGRKNILITFDRIAGSIDPGNLSILLSTVKDPDYRGYLTCRIAEKHMAKEDYGKAESVLSSFLNAYPESSYTSRAENLLRQIARDSAYDRYTIACLLPLTGRYKIFGQRALHGIQLAFQSFIHKTRKNFAKPEKAQLRLLVRDTGSDPHMAVKAVHELIQQKVAAIIGPLVTLDDAIAEVQKAHIPIITLSQGENVPQMGDYVFRNFLTAQMQTHALVAYASETLGFKKFAVLYPDEAYGKIFANCFWDDVLAHGGQIVGFESYNPEETDFADPIKKLVGLYYKVPEDLKEKVAARYAPPLSDEAYEPEEIKNEAVEEDDDETKKEEEAKEEEPIVDFDALFIPDGPTKAGLILPQLAYYDIKDVLVMGTNLWCSDKLVNMAKKYANGAIMPTAFWEESRAPQVREFSSRFETLFGEKPDFIAAVSYDTANILFSIITDPNVHYRSTIRDRLATLSSFPGITGTTSFDKNGEVHKALSLLKIRGRRFVEIVSGQHSDASNTMAAY